MPAVSFYLNQKDWAKVEDHWKKAQKTGVCMADFARYVFLHGLEQLEGRNVAAQSEAE